MFSWACLYHGSGRVDPEQLEPNKLQLLVVDDVIRLFCFPLWTRRLGEYEQVPPSSSGKVRVLDARLAQNQRLGKKRAWLDAELTA